MRSSKNFRVAAATMSTVAALALATVVAPAATAEPVGSLACGWDPDAPKNQAWYNHCATSGSVVIRIEKHGKPGTNRCIPPGRWYLGPLNIIKYAWYTGKTC
ncbi:DUF6355 family natural product biosynthesis protein [Actinokineospora globicatena]|uniref:DUF6355 family natural product biosynthesis protein n=1 Tax=Actinokineospora globicatena TaxID=103729 RepID=UPI0020A32C9F|nr:DUF6355 family natural product biosynthesis protein [Actinokineospora globicatena]MCP2303730.1 hypothetical protein [Actinokineospora globicatena]GLW79122.1 hypothetical protein Aglo01_36040 [Actinokineospora globicatena]GLW86468.1 hypothetical protein Aglo02_41070 [Actinokineospora globicatena]